MLEAGLTLFSRHGFRRTSMADIAREAGTARATLYLHFADKSALFARLAAAIVDDALAKAQSAWIEGAPLAQNLEATVLGKDLDVFRLLRSTPHGADLLDLNADLAKREAARLEQGFAALLTRRAEAAERSGARLQAFGGPEGFAAFLATTASGIKYESRSEADYRTAIRRLARVTAAAAGLDPADGQSEVDPRR